MFQEQVLAPDRVAGDYVLSATLPYLSPIEDFDREEIVRVLDRAASDDGFIAQLTCQGSEALRDYHLTVEGKAALLSGDVRWIEARVGKLDTRLNTWLQCRLGQEIW